MGTPWSSGQASPTRTPSSSEGTVRNARRSPTVGPCAESAISSTAWSVGRPPAPRRSAPTAISSTRTKSKSTGVTAAASCPGSSISRSMTVPSATSGSASPAIVSSRRSARASVSSMTSTNAARMAAGWTLSTASPAGVVSARNREPRWRDSAPNATHFTASFASRSPCVPAAGVGASTP